MQLEQTPIEGLLIIKPKVFTDERGYFMESYNQKQWFDALGVSFVQDNESLSKKNTLRGLHFQKPPFAQDKLVRVIRGSVLDVAVDIRHNSPTYGQYFSIVLSDINKKQLFIPKGFAHGFLSLEDDTVFAYKCSEYYHAASEDSLRWNDSDLAIEWNIIDPILSEKDSVAKNFATFNSPF
jgi:dTDP-4-dehydrorhamnose 3,5-epimerase